MDSARAATKYHCLAFAAIVAAVAGCLFFRLSAFPGYFFCDEALHALLAERLLESGTDTTLAYWPVLFRGFGSYELGLSVYLQVPFSYLLGATEESVRIKTACVTLALACAIALALRRVQGFASWWASPAIIFSSSVFFLHARTGFQAPIAVLLFMLFVVSYLAWRVSSGARDRELLTISLVSGVLCLYTYTAARGWVFLTGVGFLLLDARLLLRRRRDGLATPAIIAAAAAIPFASFLIAYPERIFLRYGQLRPSSAPWTAPWLEKALANVTHILDPRFWFGTSLQLSFAGAERHRVAGLPYVPQLLIIFVVLGAMAVARRRSFMPLPHLLIASASGIFPAAFVEVNPLRCFTVWAGVMLFAIAGFEAIFCRLRSSSRRASIAGRYALAGSLLAIMAYQSYWAAFSAKAYVKTWGFWGLQAGSRELGEWLRDNTLPSDVVFVDIETFNRPAETLAPFFPGALTKVRLRPAKKACSIDGPTERQPVPLESALFVTRSPHEKMPTCGVDFTLRHTITDPYGKPLINVFALRGSKPGASEPGD